MRYIPHTAEDIEAMLEAIGMPSIDALFEQIPQELRARARDIELPPPMSEIQLEKHVSGLAGRNRAAQLDTVSFMGAGLYHHVVPSAVGQMLLRAEFLTSYTPYQPEISQGTTKAIFEFQSMVAELLDMPIANASMYDGAHATAEAALMAQRATRREQIFVARSVHPEYRHVVRTYLRAQGETYNEFDFDSQTGRISLANLEAAIATPSEAACIVFQTPNFLGVLEDPSEVVAWAHENGIMVVGCFNEPHAFALTRPPGSFGVDMCVGEGMGFGAGLGFGGPALGIFAGREKQLRTMPGRLAGRTVDTEGREGYVLTLSTREQHIRRERATSNICTNQGLMALGAAIYLSLMGKEGLRELAELNLSRARYAQQALCEVGGARPVYSAPFFNEFVVELPMPARDFVDSLLDEGILAGYDLGRVDPQWERHLLVAVTELTDREAIDRLAQRLQKA